MAVDNLTHFSGLKVNDGSVLELGSFSSAPSNPLVGQMYYNIATGKGYTYQATGWTSMDGTAAGSLDAAYNGGATIAVDVADVILNLSDSSNDYDFQIRNTSSGTIASGLVVDAYASSSVFTDAISIITTAGAITDGVDASDAGITNAINVGGNVIIGTTATINFTNFDVAGTGNTTIGGTLDVAGTSDLVGAVTITGAVASAGTITSQGKMILDLDNAEAFLIRTDGDGADVLTIDTTGDAGDTTMLLTPTNTTGTGFHIDGSTFTTGDVFKVTVAASTMGAAGAAISVVADGTEVFAVRDDGSVLMAGTAEGTTAASIGLGDLVVTDGDLTLSGGEASITTDTAGNILTLENTETGATGVVVKVNHNSASPADDDIAFTLNVYADDDGGDSTNISSITVTQLDVTASSDDAEISFATMIAGTKQEMLCLNDDEGADIIAYYPVNIETITADQFVIVYDGSNSFGIDVDSDGSTTLTTTGTNADFEIASGTSGDITLDSAGDVIIQAAGSDVTMDAPLNITVAGGSQLELIAAGSIKCVDSVANTTGATTRTCSGGSGSTYEIVAAGVTIDSSVDIALEAAGGDINADAPINITVAAGSQLELIAAGSIKCVDSVANTTGVMTRTVSGGTTNSYEIVADKIILDSAGDIDIEAGGDDINMDSPLNITDSGGSQLELISAGALKAVFDSAATTANLTITASGGTTNVIELVGDTLTLDSAGAIALESTGVTSNAEIVITQAAGSQLELVASGSIKCVDSVADTTGNMTRTISGGSGNTYEVVANAITLDSAAAIALESTGVTSDAEIKITQAAGSQLELISAGALKAVFDSAGTTANLTITASGGTGNVIELVGDTLTLDSAGAIALESTGVTSNAEIVITQAAGSQLELVASGSIKCVDSVADTTGNMTRTISGGSGNTYEIVATGITLDSGGNINLEATSTVAVTGALTVSTTSTLTGAVTCTAGVQSAAVARTATTDGDGTGAIAAGTSFVTVTSDTATKVITLPAAVIGNVITLYCAANGYELQTPDASNATINNVDCDGANELAVAATDTVICTCVAANTWVATKISNLGAVATAGIPDADA